jgi:hypothetical protein
MGEQVLKRLESFVDIQAFGHEEGLVAGQSVASAIAEIVGSPHATAFNDVDIFRKIRDSERKRTTHRVLNMVVQKETKLDVAYGQITVCDEYHYQVARTRREGLLNEVLCYGSAFSQLNDSGAQRILNSFDLNCVQVGVNLDTRQLVWTPAFERFVNTQQLLVENVRTPVHTAIRWFRKKAELEGVYGNDAHTMELLAFASKQLRPWEDCDAKFRGQLNFSNHYLEKFKDISSAIAPWMQLTKQAKAYDEDEDFGGAVDLSAEIAPEVARETHVPPKKQGNIDLYSLTPRFDPPSLLSDGVYAGLLVISARAHQGFWKKNICEQILRAVNSTRTIEHKHLAVYGSKELETQLSQKSLAKTNNILDQHNIGRFCDSYPLQRKMEFVQMLSELASKHGDVVYGLMERDGGYSFRAVKNLPVSEMKEFFDMEISNRLAQMRAAKTVSPLVPDLELPGGFRLTELTTALELAEEGVRMHHCVHGYFESVARGTCRILSLRKHKTSESLTMECRKGYLSYSQTQLRGVSNRTPNEVEEVAGACAEAALIAANWLAWLPVTTRKALLQKIVQSTAAVSLLCSFGTWDFNQRPENLRIPGFSMRLKQWLELKVMGRVAFRASRVAPNRYLMAATAPWPQLFAEWSAVIVQKVLPPPAELACSIDGLPQGLQTRSTQSNGFNDLEDSSPF